MQVPFNFNNTTIPHIPKLQQTQTPFDTSTVSNVQQFATPFNTAKQAYVPLETTLAINLSMYIYIYMYNNNIRTGEKVKQYFINISK